MRQGSHRVWVWMSLCMLGLGHAPLTYANPHEYPQFAQQHVDPTIMIDFMSPETVKGRLDTRAAVMLVDVRDLASYTKAHLPGAVSIPLDMLPKRLAEIPRDIPVVFY